MNHLNIWYLLPGRNFDVGEDSSPTSCRDGYVRNGSGGCVQQTELEKIMKCEELSDVQLNQLEKVLAEYLNNCFLMNIYEYQIDNEVKLCFKMGASSLNEAGGYYPSSKTINFLNNSSINTRVFGEEFFHSYQHSFYGSMPTNIGRSNIEFETKVFWDIVTQPGRCCSAFTNPDAPIEDYLLWLDEISNGFTVIPSWSDIEGEYYYWVDQFVNYEPLYNYPIDYNRTPDAMLNFTGGC